VGIALKNALSFSDHSQISVLPQYSNSSWLHPSLSETIVMIPLLKCWQHWADGSSLLQRNATL